MAKQDWLTRGNWAFVTGGSDGLGLALAKQVAAQGMNCLLVARNEAKLVEAAETIRASGVEARTLSLDLGAEDAVARIAAATADLPLALAVFNAGAEASGDLFIESDYAQWRSVIQRNVLFLTEALHHFGQRLAQQGHGGMVVVGSEAAFGGVARSGLYTATKGYALNLGESLWAELAPHGVDVITLLFKIADTPTLRSVLARKEIPIEATGASDPEKLARATIEALGTGPVINVDEEGPDDTLTSNRLRKARVIESSKRVELFYG